MIYTFYQNTCSIRVNNDSFYQNFCWTAQVLEQVVSFDGGIAHVFKALERCLISHYEEWYEGLLSYTNIFSIRTNLFRKYLKRIVENSKSTFFQLRNSTAKPFDCRRKTTECFLVQLWLFLSLFVF